MFFMHLHLPGLVGGVKIRGRRDLANVNALKNHVRSLLLHKN